MPPPIAEARAGLPDPVPSVLVRTGAEHIGSPPRAPVSASRGSTSAGDFQQTEAGSGLRNPSALPLPSRDAQFPAVNPGRKRSPLPLVFPTPRADAFPA